MTGEKLRELPPTSPFAGDDGACPAALAAALAVTDPARRVEAVVAALATVRVLVPVLAHPEPAAQAGRPTEQPYHGSAAAVVVVAGPDGRAVLPVFSCLAAMSRWDAAARPVPAEGPRAALAAQAEADGLVVLDPAGPAPVLVPRPAVAALGRGTPWVPSPRDPRVAEAVTGALAEVPGLVAVRCESGRRAELAVVLGVRPGLDRGALDTLVADAGAALGASAVVAERVDSVELRVVRAP